MTGQPVETIEATRQHPFYVEGKGFVAAAALGIGNAIVTRAGPPLVVGRMAWERRAEGYDVYNLIVEGDHTYFVGNSGGGVWVHNGQGVCDPLGPNANGLSRPDPTIPNGNSNSGWQHIYERHATGNAAGGAGDLFPNGTTRAQLETAAKDVVKSGVRNSDPNRAVQVFQRRIMVNGVRRTVRAVIGPNGHVITIFPVMSE